MPYLFSIFLWLLIAFFTKAASAMIEPHSNLTLPKSTNVISASRVNRVTFQQTVYFAIPRTLAYYPHALLHEVGAVSTNGATTDPYLLNKICLIFAIPHHAPYTTLIVEMSNRWGMWLEPHLSKLPVPRRENVMTGWPERDIEVANEMKERAEFTGPYWSFIICWPYKLPPVRDQPMYMFQMEDESPGTPNLEFVGTRGGRVLATYNARQPDQPHSGRMVSTT